MPAHVTVSRRFTNPAKVADDLLCGLAPAAPAVGFLTYDYQLDAGALAKALEEKAPFPVVGVSTVAFPLVGAGEDEDEMSAQLVVLEKDGLLCHVEVSPPMDDRDLDGQMAELHRACVANAGFDPTLFIILQPILVEESGEMFNTAFLRCAGGVPVVGGLSSAEMESGLSAVIASGAAWKNRVVVLALGGSVRPVVASGSQISTMGDYSPVVTRAKDNYVYTVDDMTGCEYLESLGIGTEASVDGTAAFLKYATMPVYIRGRLEEDDGLPEIRGINGACPADGSILFTCGMAEGCRISVGILEKSDIVDSARAAAAQLNQRMAAAGEDFSMVIGVTCISRYFAMVGGPNGEDAALLQTLPKGLPVFSWYAYGEVGPTLGAQGQVHNRTYNNSIVLCAL